MRADLILDMAGDAGSRVSVIDRFYEGLEYRLVDIVYADTPLRERTPDWPLALPANPLPEPDLETASRNEVVFTGGMMGEMVAQRWVTAGCAGRHDGRHEFDDGRQMMRDDEFQHRLVHQRRRRREARHVMEPMLTLARNKSHVIAMTNATAWHHPIHLHGHSFRVISRNGQPTRHREWQDTVLVSPREKVEIAFVADNPGDWMFHCHILEHQAGGMMAVFRVA